MKDTIRLIPLLLCGSLLSLFLSGCASYQLGSAGEVPFETVYVRPVVNDSYAAQVDAILSSQIREMIIRDGRVKIVGNEQNADAVLEVTTTQYTRNVSARRTNDTALAANFDLILEASISMYDNRSSEPYFENRKVSQRINTYVDNPYFDQSQGDLQDFVQSEYQATPKLTREMARRIVDQALGAW